MSKDDCSEGMKCDYAGGSKEVSFSIVVCILATLSLALIMNDCSLKESRETKGRTSDMPVPPVIHTLKIKFVVSFQFSFSVSLFLWL